MRVLIFLLTLFLAVSSAWAAPAKLSERDRADVARLESYLNAMKSLTAGFTQINDGGEFRHGSLAIQRPGKMRVTYDPPHKDFLVNLGNAGSPIQAALRHGWQATELFREVPGEQIAALARQQYLADDWTFKF